MKRLTVLGLILVLAALLLMTPLCIESVQAPLTWSIQTVDSTGPYGAYASIALDSSDNPHIGYLHRIDKRDDGSLRYAKWTGSAWSITTVDSTGNVGMNPSLALDSSNNPHISYWANWDLKYAKWTGSAWSITTVESAGDVGGSTSLALDSSNNPHISYNYMYSGLRYARWTGSAWSITTVDSTGNVGSYTSIALDSSNNPHISYYDWTNYDLKYAKWTGSAWSIQTVDSAGDVGSYTSIALDSSDNPHISYYDGTSYDLKYAKWTGSAWSIQTVDSAGYVGLWTSLALDSSNNPHISYWNGTEGDLKYAKWTGSAWSITTVDSTGNAGSYTSLALDSSNNPHIGYRAGGDLRYATLAKVDTQLTFTLSPNLASPRQLVTLLGRLTESDSGNPVVNARVDVYGRGGPSTPAIATLWTNSSGWFEVKAFAPLTLGAYPITVIYEGNATHNPSSHTETLTVQMPGKVDTQLTFTMSPNPASPGQTVTLSGTLKDVNLNPVYPAQVKVEYSVNGGATWNSAWTLNTNSAGAFSVRFAAPGVGTYLVRVSYAGSSTYNPSSYTQTLTVQTGGKVNTQITFTLSPNPARSRQTVLLSGTLRDANSNPVYPAQVKVEYSTNGGASWNLVWTLNTNAAGAFSQSFTAPGAGTYLVRASYAGSTMYNPSSNTQTLTINP